MLQYICGVGEVGRSALMWIEMANSAILIIIFLERRCYNSDSCIFQLKILNGLAFDNSI